MSLLLFYIVLISIFYATYLNQKSGLKQFEKLKKQIADEEKNEIKYDFNRFSTKATGSPRVRTDKGMFLYQSDVKHIQVANETLGLTIQTKLGREIYRAQLFIKPFVCELFDEESYRQFDLNGIIIFSGFYQEVFNFCNEGNKLKEEEVVYWNLKEVILDPNEDQIVFKGNFIDENKYKLYLNKNSFELKLEAFLSAVNDKNNFQPFDITQKE